MDTEKIKNVLSNFENSPELLSVVRYGTGHINDTYRAFCRINGREEVLILQRLNTQVFRQPELLMSNMDRVTAHLREKYRKRNQPGRCRTIDLLYGKSGKPFVCDPDGGVWRAYFCICGCRAFEVMSDAKQAFEVGRSFGKFQCDLVDLPGERLQETIPNFHHTPSRFATLEKAIAEDACGRLKSVGPEVDFILSRKAEASRLLDLCAAGAFPERITHNDTKLNNILFDDCTNESVAVIDLDTVMPGLVHYDFGDMVRTGTSPAPEDELDLNKVGMRFEMFEGLLRGYLASAAGFLTKEEREELPFCGKLITLEIGVRFLTDFLEGDHYFKIHRPNHNLDRCRTQLKLVASIESQFDKMCALLRDI